MFTYYILYSIQIYLVLYVLYSLFVSCLITTVLINYQNSYHLAGCVFSSVVLLFLQSS